MSRFITVELGLDLDAVERFIVSARGFRWMDTEELLAARFQIARADARKILKEWK